MFTDMGLNGYYDDKGRWQRTKFCLVACRHCDCGPPGGMWYSAAHDKRPPCVDCGQPMADHFNGCPVYPPLGTPGVTCSPDAAGAPVIDAPSLSVDRIRAIANECGMFDDAYENTPGEHCDKFAAAILAGMQAAARPYSPDPQSDDYPTVKESMEAAARREAFLRAPGRKAWGCLREAQAIKDGEDPVQARCLGYCGHPNCPTTPGVSANVAANHYGVKEPSADKMLGNLLARIHRDGGHYVMEHGWQKAAEDAEAKVLAERRALALACFEDEAKVAFYLSEAEAEQAANAGVQEDQRG